MTPSETEILRRLLALEESKAAMSITLREYMERRFHDHEEVHGSEDRAASLARDNLNVRLESMNEFRQQMGDQVSRFITRDLADERVAAINVRLSYLENTAARDEGRRVILTGIVALAASALVSLSVGLMLR